MLLNHRAIGDIGRLTWFVKEKQEYLAKQIEVGQAYRRPAVSTLKQVDNPDEIINILPEQCPNCQTEFSLDDSEDYVRRQVFDVPPPPPPVVTSIVLMQVQRMWRRMGEFPANVSSRILSKTRRCWKSKRLLIWLQIGNDTS